MFDAQKDPALWALVSPTLPSGYGALMSSQADCVKGMASGGLTVLPSFLFTAAAAGLAVFGACARFA